MNERYQGILTTFGLRFGINGPHAARTMMFDDLQVLFAALSPESAKQDYVDQINDLNLLGKPTKKSRELAARHLVALYGLDPALPLFRMFRALWTTDTAARPVLALTMAIARDPLLAGTQEWMLQQPEGGHVSREALEAALIVSHPDRFSGASLKSFAQNVNGTWTSAGYLMGKTRKFKTQPTITPANAVFCLFLGYLEGMSGQRLFTSRWSQLLASTQQDLEALVNAAHHRGLIVFLQAGGVKEVRFPGRLTPAEEQIRQELTHDI